MPSALVRLFAGPYIAGDSIAAALEVAAGLLENERALSTLDILGEETKSDAEADEFALLYAETIAAIARDPRMNGPTAQPTLSFKPSALGGSAARIRGVVETAQAASVDVTLDMEDRNWTEFTVATCIAMRDAGFTNFGTVLQTRLHRTEKDLDRIAPGTRIRLVIGIYNEPPEFAIQSRPEMKERMLVYGKRLLERGVKVEFATHDEVYVRRFVSEVLQPGGYGAEHVEFQFLLGVPRRALQAELIAAGYTVRIYVPFATEWADAIAYARRRLHENPAIMSYGIKNLMRVRNR